MLRPFLVRIDRGPLPPPGGPTKTRLAVRAVIRRDGRLLMIQSAAFGDWKFPGGGLEPRETPEETLIREVAEETGYEAIGPFRLLGRTVEREEGRDVPGSRFEMESRYFRASVGAHTSDLDLDDYERDLGFEPAWVSATEALATNQALEASGRRDLPPWITREIRVLEILTSPSGRPL